MEINNIEQLDLSKRYTYHDYFKWQFEDRVELYNGKVYKIGPSPGTKHQRISNELSYRITKHVSKLAYQVFCAPFDVRLERVKDDKNVINVVQPDICVICDLSKIDERGCSGAPELVVEILSPGNNTREMNQKFDLYEAAGVLKYRIVDPEKEVVFQYFRENNNFINYRPLTKEHTIKSRVVDGFEIELSTIF